MKPKLLSTGLLLTCLATIASAQTDAPQLYLNKNLGFDVEGYKYAQSELPCKIDTVLVENILQRAQAKGIGIEATDSADKLLNRAIPVLAIDIEALALGSEEYTFGTRATGGLPSVKVTTALIQEDLPDGYVTAKHSCGFTSLREFTPSSDVMDLGAYGHTVCSATRKCLEDLGNDIVEWFEPRVR